MAALAPRLSRIPLLNQPPPLLLNASRPHQNLFPLNPSAYPKKLKPRSPQQPQPPQQKFPAVTPWLFHSPLASTPSRAKLNVFLCPARTLMQSSAIKAFDGPASWILALVELLSNWNPRKKSRKVLSPSCTCPFFRPCASI